MDKMSYHDIFRLDEGEHIEHVVATAYSLDISMVPLLALYTENKMIYKYFDDYGNTDICKNTLAKIFFPQSEIPQLEIFYQYDCLSNGRIEDKSLARVVLEYKGMRPIHVENNVCFHPKFIFIKINNNENTYYRLAVSTRNLTFGESEESTVYLQGCLKDSESENILSVDEYNKDNNTRFEAISDFLMNKVSWKLIDGEPVDEKSIDGAPIEKNGTAGIKWKIKEGYNPKVYIQITGRKDSKICSKMPENLAKGIIVSPGHFDNCILERLKGNCEKYNVVKQNGSDKGVLTHEKIYLLSEGKDTPLKPSLWIGSSNCSKRGLGDGDSFNTECMVKLQLTEDEYREFEQYFAEKYKYIDNKNANANEEIYDDILDENKAYVDKLGELVKFIRNVKVMLEIKPLRLDCNDYNISLRFIRPTTFTDDEWNNYKENLYISNSFDSIQFGYLKEGVEVKNQITLTAERIEPQNITNSILLKMETEDHAVITRIFYPDIEDSAKEIIDSISEQECDKIKKDFKTIKDYFPKKKMASSGDNTGTHEVIGNKTVYSATDGEYEKLMKLYINDEINSYSDFLEGFLENNYNDSDDTQAEKIKKIRAFADSLIKA